MVAGCHPPPNDYQVCSSYGLSRGQDGRFAQCMGERQQSRDQALQMLLMNRQQQMVPYTPINVQFQRSINTNCMRMGNSVSCTSQ